MQMQRWVLVTTDKDKRGVFFGMMEHEDGDTVVLTKAKMVIYWSKKTQGVLGLAAIGPQDGSKLTPEIPRIKLYGVTSISDVTKEGITRWQMNLWG